MFYLLYCHLFHLFLITVAILPFPTLILFNCAVESIGLPEFMMTVEEFFDIMYNITHGVSCF